MTTEEFSDEFDVLYNNIKSQSSPGLDAYEKSLFLTLAQEELVEKAYRGINITRESFEETEFLRRNLDDLIKQIELVTPVSIANSNKITEESVFFEIPNELLYITHEELKGNKTNCSTPIKLSVYPIRQDEFDVHYDNPFRKPSTSPRNLNAWRLDYGNHINRIIEIVPPLDFTISNYKLRYVKTPVPIVLEDLQFQLNIRGVNVKTQCELKNNIIQRHILNRAVELAKVHYDAGDTNTILQNNRMPV
jgi:hypothetical protein